MSLLTHRLSIRPLLVCLAMLPTLGGLVGCGEEETEVQTLQYDPESAETKESEAFDARMNGG